MNEGGTLSFCFLSPIHQSNNLSYSRIPIAPFDRLPFFPKTHLAMSDLSLKRSHAEVSGVIQEEGNKKTRQIPHVEGNWPSFAYIEVSAEDHHDVIERILDHINESVCKKEESQFKLITEESHGFNKCHVSLTKLFFLREFQIDPFVREVRRAIKAKPFGITLSQPQIFTNDDQSRSFCSILVQRGFNSVVQIIHQLDEVLRKYQKDVYYDPPVPHCTVGSCLGDYSKQAKEKGMYGNEYQEIDEYDSDDEDMIEEDVTTIHLSIGNRHFTISLA